MLQLIRRTPGTTATTSERYACIQAHVCTGMQVPTCVFVCTSAHMYAYRDAGTEVCMHVCVHFACMYVCMSYVCIYLRMMHACREVDKEADRPRRGEADRSTRWPVWRQGPFLGALGAPSARHTQLLPDPDVPQVGSTEPFQIAPKGPRASMPYPCCASTHVSMYSPSETETKRERERRETCIHS